MRKLVEIFLLKPNYEKRVFGLDLMRALAIIFVVMGHGLMLEKANTKFPWIPLINGVEMFFVLSGFLIGSILLKIYTQEKSFTFKTLKDFWIRRWFRTLPNYYLVLILNILFVYFGIIQEDFSKFNWKYFLFLQNFTQPLTGFFWESWSLSVEEWFYLLFPIILTLVFTISKKLNISKLNIFTIAVAIFLLVPFLLRFFIASKFEVDFFWLDVKIFKVVVYRLDGIALGLLAALVKFTKPVFWQKSRNYLFVAGLIISFGIHFISWPPNDFTTKVYLISIQSFGCLLLLPKFDSIKKAPLFLTKIFTHISLISYSMYLINLALISQVIMTHFPPENALSAWGMYLAFWISVIIFSTFLYKYFEKPLMDLREKF